MRTGGGGSYLDVIVGGQFGSESKGRVTGEITARRRAEGKHVTGVRVAGPNAGHVIYDDKGNRFALRQVPVSMVVDPYAVGVIAAGSEIDPEVLEAEIADLESQGHSIRHRLLIDSEATILEPMHRDLEGGNGGHLQNRIGSTGKGIGAARSARVWRTAKVARDWPELQSLCASIMADTGAHLSWTLDQSDRAVIIEGTQGFGLGQHAGYYPQCTSSDCRAIDFLSMAGVSPWAHAAHFTPWVVLRTFPIRVAGNSGPLEGETTWSALGLPAEYTTVTHKERRVGAWDPQLARRAIRANGGRHCRVVLAMADQMWPELAGVTDWANVEDPVRLAVEQWIELVQGQIGAPIVSLGTGPTSSLARRVSLLTGKASGGADAPRHLVEGSTL